MSLIRIAAIVAVEVATLSIAAGVATAQVAPRILIKDVEIRGNTIFDSELQSMVASYEGREISLEEVFRLKDKISKYYIDNGYKSSGAFLPPQRLTDGRVQIQVVEGTLKAIEIEGSKNLSEAYLKSRLPKEGKLLNVDRLYQSLLKLRSDPLIKQINAELIEEKKGQNILLVNLEENSPWNSQLSVTDGYARSIGGFGGNAQVTHQNLFGFGDRLTLERSQTEGLGRTGGRYSFPFNSLDGRIAFSYNNAQSVAVEEEIEELGVEADYESFQLNISQPLIATRTDNFSLGLGIEYIDSETFVLEDLSFSFVEGLENGETKLTVLNFSQNYLRNGNNSLLAIESKFNFGIDALGATQNELGIDGIFSSWQGNLQYLKAFGNENAMVLSTGIAFQLTTDRLLPIERFTIGGVDSVKGYSSNIGDADNGIVGNIELRIPVIGRRKSSQISVVPFINAGTIWNNDEELATNSNFASTGLGLIYQSSFLEGRIDYAIPLIEAQGYGETDTEQRFIFSLVIYPL